MALRENRYIGESDVSRILDDVAAPGAVLCFASTVGSGAGLGDNAGKTTLVSTSASVSGKLVHGILLQNFVDIDETRYHLNYFKDEHNIGSPANVLTKGWVETNMVVGSPTDGAKAYLTASGLVTPTVHAGGGVAATPYVGRFEGIKDQDGYIKLVVNLPQDIV